MHVIPLNVYNENGSISNNIDTILHTWNSEFKGLFNKPDNVQFNNEFFEECINLKKEKDVKMENDNYVHNPELNFQITMNDIALCRYNLHLN